uniref:Polyribonucleotide nucleotidyltransferase (PNPase)) n=1 Tax=Ganoderma boninense TaxID=34458 RepID=A0A5K1JWF1_9APHY|nr:Polyribonucleotide nucleotidyltransferase (EC (Polynucleotide phosphorylase) (PNPase) [Ganoderma boninense]
MSAPDRSPSPNPSKRRRVTVEEVEDEESSRAPWEHEAYLGEAGRTEGEGTTYFEALRAEQTEHGRCQYFPFADDEEWGLADWLLDSTTQGGADKFCKLPIVRNRLRLTFKNKKAYMKKIDQLPTGASWVYDILTVTGNRTGSDGERLTEDLELWRRDPVELTKELIGNPAFKEFLAYAPVRVRRGGVRFYGEMNTADWWWNIQGRLPSGAVVCPLIVASDKTNLTVLRGDKTAWPVYLTIGNIDKSVRRKPSAHAFLLLGYIPVSKLACFTKSARSEAIYRLFHTCMAKILAPLIQAGQNGVLMTCADGHIRRVFPILAAYIADHPEQCLIACCKENRCPRCLVPRKQRGSPTEHPLRSQSETLEILREAEANTASDRFADQGLRPVYHPFWADLPHTDIFACITPDILHQIHKGVIKDHLVQWVQKIVGKEDLDERFAVLPDAHGLRHFRRGISFITQWTGSEAKEIEKVLVGLLVGQTDPDTLTAARALLDFVYYAQYEVHSDTTLKRMKKALDDFHRHKDAFTRLGIRKHFNIPKLHSLFHYVNAIYQLGCLDGFNTETSERLHIDFAKDAYRASSKRDYFAQMTTWLQRREAIARQMSYLAWVQDQLAQEVEADELVGALKEMDLVQDGDASDQDEEDEEAEDASHVELEDVTALQQLLHSNVSRAYQIPFAPSAHLSLEELTDTAKYAALSFLPQLNIYVAKEYPHLHPVLSSTLFDIYHSIHILRPSSIHVPNSKHISKLRATPTIPRLRDRQSVQEHFDCGLFINDYNEYRRDGGLKGLRAGQVRVIFRLPLDSGYPQEPLLYVRWFRPFRTPDPITSLPPTSHSTRRNARNVSVVPASHLIQSCHLIPKFGTDVLDPDWTSQDILDEPVEFLFNRYLDPHTFASLAS